MNNPTNSGRRFFGALLPTLILASSFAWGGAVYTIQNGGVPRQFEIADDEVSIFRKTAGLAVDVKTVLPEGVVVKDYGQRVVVRFAQGDWRKAVGPRAVGGAEFEPVMYEQGQTRTDSARRMVTAKVLATGANEAELVRISGAASAKATKVEGYVMLNFASPAEALVGTEKLRKGGLKAEPQLRTQMSKMAAPEIPNDPLYLDQWHLSNSGNSGGVPGIDANILLAWNYQLDGAGPDVISNGFTGAGVTIGILDDSLELDHEDLAPNIVQLADGDVHYDFNNGDNDPTPEVFSGDFHGTACAGVAAGRGNNGRGVMGGAPEAALVGLRLISGPASDADFAGAFSWAGGTTPVSLDISSNSWGPRSGLMFGPDILAANALRTSATTGRGGKGVVFLFAAGNGRENEDDVNMNGYANSRYTIAVGAITNAGKQSYYSNNGSSLLVSAPSNGGTLGITTTDVMGGEGYSTGNYANDFGGTSSATPLVAGIVGLMLEANPDLGYRDVMEILASTAATVDATNLSWHVNSAGFHFSHAFGGGMADATAAIVRALDWTNLAPETQAEVILNAPAVPVGIPDANTLGITRSFNFTGTNLRVEHVEVQLDIGHAHRSDLHITLTSPSGQVSRIIEKRNRPFFDSDVDYTDGNLGWTFGTTQHWGEAASGTWTLNINDTEPGTAGILRKARVRLFGTPSTSSSRFTFDKKLVNVSELAGMADLTVRRVGNLAGAASVDYYISDKTAATSVAGGLEAQDFRSVTGTLSFSGGEEVKTIQVPILDDTETEADERFIVVLKNPVGASFGGVTVQTVEIDDDEGNSVSVTATDTTGFERNLANQKADNGVFTISRKQAVATPLTVKFTLKQPPAVPVVGAPNYAAHPLDFSEIPLTATIPAGETSVDVVIRPKDDRFSEGTEIVELTLTPDATYNLGLPNSSIVSIVDDDLVPVSVNVSQASVVESDPTKIVFTIIRDTNQLDSPLSIFLNPSGTATGGRDYKPEIERGSVVIIPAGKVSTTVTIEAIDNSGFDPLRTVILGVSQGPEYKEGFFRSVEFRIFDDEPLPDAVKPTVLIAAPTAEQRIDSPAVVTASGTATDNPDGAGNTNAKQVRFRINGVEDVAALTNNDWSADITAHVSLGNNVLEVYSIDEADNESKIVSQKFTYVKPRNLTTTVVGPGSITADFVGTKPLEVGQEYTIVAKPNAGANLFDGWSGEFSATTKSLSFTMPDEDIVLTATFASALIDEAVIGKFAGNVSRDTLTGSGSLFDVTTSGYFTATISKTGKFSGKLIYGGVNYSVKGEMTAQGQFIGEIPRKNNTPLSLNLSLDTAVAGSKRLTGRVSADGIDSGIICPKVLTKAEALVATAGFVGSYTFQLPMDDLRDDSKPQGTGVGTLKLDAKGNVRWNGVLPDGAKVSQVAPLSNDKTWAFFQRLDKGRGVMLGTVTQTVTAMSGNLSWHKVGDPRDKFFPGGFRIENTQLTGLVYVPPADGVRVLPSFASGNGTLILEEGNFRVPFPAKTIGITDRNKVTVAPIGADKLELGINVKTGAMIGNFIHPVTGVKTKIFGVVLQSADRFIGIFEGSTPSSTALQTGRMSITSNTAN